MPCFGSAMVMEPTAITDAAALRRINRANNFVFILPKSL